MKKEHLFELISQLLKMKEEKEEQEASCENSITTLHCLVQMKSFHDIKVFLDSISTELDSSWKVDFRNSKIVMKTDSDLIVIRFEKLISDKDYHGICGSSFNAVVMHNDYIRNYILARLRLYPQKVFIYDDNTFTESSKYLIKE